MMKIIFFVNDAFDIKPSQTTYLFIKEALIQHHETWISSVPHKEFDQTVTVHKACLTNDKEFSVNHESSVINIIEETDIIWIRTNPSRDLNNLQHHIQLLDCLEKLSTSGKRVINDPRGLKYFLDKSYLLDLPSDTIPKTRLARNHNELLKQLSQFSDKVVCKPLQGTRGQGIVSFNPSAPPSSLTFPVLVQEFVTTETAGDQRIYLLNGQPFKSHGKTLIIHRTPPQGDFRANIHLGGTPEKATLSKSQLKTINCIQTILKEKGIVQAGLDMMHDKIIEINVFSPGGFFPANRLYHENFEVNLISATI